MRQRIENYLSMTGPEGQNNTNGTTYYYMAIG